METMIIFCVVCSFMAFAVALYFSRWIDTKSTGNEKIVFVSNLVKKEQMYF